MIGFFAAFAIALGATAGDANATVSIDGISVAASHVHELYQAFQASQSTTQLGIKIENKPATQMPWYDPHWHYAGTQSGSPAVATVWINGDDVAAGDAKTHDVVVGITAGVLLSIMDSGFAGPFWKEFYDTEAARDANAAARGDNPFIHRDESAVEIAQAIVGK